MSLDKKSFGRRTEIDGSPTGQRSESTGLICSRGAKQLGGVLLGVVLALGIVALNHAGMKSAGRALDRFWDNAGYTSIGQSPSAQPKSVPTYNDLYAACQDKPKAVRLSRAMEMELDHFTNIRVGELQVERHATFIDCLMSTSPSRFCEAEHRTRLADAIRAYFGLRVRVREEWGMMRRSPFGAHAVGLTQPPGTEAINTRYPSETTDPRIVGGLARLIAEGYLTRADLGGGGFFGRMPGDLDEQLRGIERKKRTCG